MTGKTKTPVMPTMPGRRSLKKTEDICEEILQVDDEEERLQRHRKSGQFSHLAEKRVSFVGIGDLSSSEIFTQYQNCMRLSAENKINHKNAFNLHLIDCMSTMLKKNDSQMNNFQVASCTLDASTKIYASRVDRIHMDGLQMAHGLSNHKGSKSKEKNEDENDQDEGNDADVDEELPNKKKKKKKKRCLNDIVGSITLKVDTQIQQDATYTYMRRQFGDAQPGFINFIPRLDTKSDGCEVLMDLNEMYLSNIKMPLENVECPVTLPVDLSKEVICSTYHDILKCENAQVDFDALLRDISDDDDDLDDVPDDLPEGMDMMLDGENVEDIEEDEALQDTLGTVGAPVACGARMKPDKLIDLQRTLLQHQVKTQNCSLEYSYMKLDKMLYAGPSHWRRLPLLAGSNVAEKKSLAEKKKQKRKLIEFPNPIEDIDLCPGANKITLTKQYIANSWTSNRVTNPVDLHVTVEALTKLYLLRSKSFMLGGIKKEEFVPPDDVDEDVEEYDYNNLNDSQEYCPNVPEGNGVSDDDRNEAETVGIFSNPAEDIHSQADKGDWDLVDPPQKVARINIPYAQRAKHVDMKKLKGYLWRIFSENAKAIEVSEEEESPCDVKDCKSIPTLKFSELWTMLVGTVPYEMKIDLSMPLVFTALLHLANERTLFLDGFKDHSDINISVDQFKKSTANNKI